MACRTCNADVGTCADGCGGDACATSSDLCARARRDAHHRQLASYLAGQGYVPSGESRSVVMREGGTITRAVLTLVFRKPGAGATAELRYLWAIGGPTAAGALIRQHRQAPYGLYVGGSGEIATAYPKAATAGAGLGGGVRALPVAAAPPTVVAATHEPVCTGCKSACNLMGVTLVCTLGGIFCTAAISGITAGAGLAAAAAGCFVASQVAGGAAGDLAATACASRVARYRTRARTAAPAVGWGR